MKLSASIEFHDTLQMAHPKILSLPLGGQNPVPVTHYTTRHLNSTAKIRLLGWTATVWAGRRPVLEWLKKKMGPMFVARDHVRVEWIDSGALSNALFYADALW